MEKAYSLALGGGAARALIHIGVYQYLRENDITIREISGTSMGSIIAALIAFGKTPEEIVDIAKSVKYMSLLDIDLNLGLIRGEKIEKLLEELFGNQEIQQMKIPLKITATNLDTGTLKVFTEGRVVDAIRASISLPGVFAPKIIEGNNYVDGGIIMNLPVQILHGENIIAVSALKMEFEEIVKTKEVLGFSFKSGFFQNNFEILNRSVNLLMKTNEDISLLTVGKNIRFFRPLFGKLDTLDFGKVDEFIKIGYEAMKKNADMDA